MLRKTFFVGYWTGFMVLDLQIYFSIDQILNNSTMSISRHLKDIIEEEDCKVVNFVLSFIATFKGQAAGYPDQTKLQMFALCISNLAPFWLSTVHCDLSRCFQYKFGCTHLSINRFLRKQGSSWLFELHESVFSDTLQKIKSKLGCLAILMFQFQNNLIFQY